MSWLPTAGDGTTHDVLSLAGPVYERYRDLHEHLWRQGGIDPAILELCRLRMAQLIGSTGELSVRHDVADVPADQLDQLRQWPTSPAFGARERAALGFAEKYVIDAHSITDDDCAELNRHFSPPELTTFTTGLAVFEAMARFRVALDCAVEASPDTPVATDAASPIA